MQFRAFILVSIQLIALLQPVSPYVDYYVNQEYIQEFLCRNQESTINDITVCGGKCYLDDQLRAQQESSNEQSEILIKTIGIYITNTGYELPIAPGSNRIERTEVPYLSFYKFSSEFDCFRPPKQV